MSYWKERMNLGEASHVDQQPDNGPGVAGTTGSRTCVLSGRSPGM
jgi:hypothetical protein